MTVNKLKPVEINELEPPLVTRTMELQHTRVENQGNLAIYLVQKFTD